MGKIEEALNAAYEDKMNTVIFGPAIGKSSRIKEWIQKKELNGYQLPDCSINPYQETTAKGVLVLDRPTIYSKTNEYPVFLDLIENDIAKIESMLSFQRTPELLFTVVVVSEYEDSFECDEKLMGHFEKRNDWRVVKVDYDKQEQLPWMIKEWEDYCDYALKNKTEDVEEYAFKIKTLKQLLEAPTFETRIKEGEKIVGLNSHQLDMLLTMSNARSIPEFLSEAEEHFKNNDVSMSFVEAIKNALIE